APRSLVLRVMTMPRDTNPYGTIFGGVILSYVDQAAMLESLSHAHCTWVTASMERVDFIAPVRLGDIVELYTRTKRVGTKSVSVCVEVDARRHATGETVRVTTATVTMVSLDHNGRPTPFAEAPPPKSRGLGMDY
ncbi:MAG: hypothetical protein K8E66_13620, partial [Phycisphaerales bacterium]|nr:hypothetical protein [Phycisphaerales bacterium]